MAGLNSTAWRWRRALVRRPVREAFDNDIAHETKLQEQRNLNSTGLCSVMSCGNLNFG